MTDVEFLLIIWMYWEVINHSPIEKVLVTLDQRQEGYFPQKMKFITQVQEISDLKSISSQDIVFSDDELILAEAKRLGFENLYLLLC